MFALVLTLALAGNVEVDSVKEIPLPRYEFKKVEVVRTSEIKAPSAGEEIALSGEKKIAPRTELKEIPWERTLNLSM